jgi:hypothetical protein
MKPIRRHVNYASVVATLALVFAMGGSAIAANHYLINSTKQINPKVLKKLKGRSGAPGSPGRAGAIGGAGAQGPKGDDGKEGAKGETGPAGQARAYGTITPGSPAEIAPGSRGIVSATTFSGITCVFLSPSIDPDTATPVVTSGEGDVTFGAHAGGCGLSSVGIEVRAFNQNGTGNTTETFQIIVP